MSENETPETTVTFRISGNEWQDIDVPESVVIDLKTAEFVAIDSDAYSKKASLHSRSVFEDKDEGEVVESSPVCSVLLSKEPVSAKIRRLYVREMKPQFRVEGPAKVTLTGCLQQYPIKSDSK